MVKAVCKSIHPSCHVPEAGKCNRNKHFPSRKVLALTALLAASSLSDPLMANNGSPALAKNNTTELIETKTAQTRSTSGIIGDIFKSLFILAAAPIVAFGGAMALVQADESVNKVHEQKYNKD